VSFFDEDFSPLGMLSGTTAGSAGLAPLDGETLADMFARLGDGSNIAFTQSLDFQMLNSVIGTLNGGASSITSDITGQINSTVTLTLSPTVTTRVLIFDDLGLPDGTVVTNQYPGVTFSAPGANTTQVVTATFPLFPNEPQGLYNDPGFVEPIIVDFAANQSAAGAFIDFGGPGDGIKIEAFDGPGGTGNLLASDSTSSETFIGVNAEGIQSVVFSQVGSGATYLIDNLTITSGGVCIDFQALEHVDGNITNHGNTYSEDGFTLNGPTLSTFGTLESRYPGSTAIFSDVVSGLIEVVQDDGGTYAAQTVDLVPLNDGNNPTTVIFNGELGGVNVANQSFTTSSIGFVLETFTFNSDFANIDRLTWTQDFPFNQVDNICLGTASDPGCPSDLDGDGDADADDFFAYLDAFAGGNLPVCDIDGDGDCDADDFFGYLDLFAQGC